MHFGFGSFKNILSNHQYLELKAIVVESSKDLKYPAYFRRQSIIGLLSRGQTNVYDNTTRKKMQRNGHKPPYSSKMSLLIIERYKRLKLEV